MKIKYILLKLNLCFWVFNLYAQSTYNDIYNIFQAKCTGACHTSTSPSGNLVLNGTQSAVYNALINVTPTNPTAAAKGNKRIAPGYPERSFLLRKCNQNFDNYYEPLSSGEGSLMPQNQTPLTVQEMEKIRQWIYFGAPQNGIVIQDSTINDFYNGQGMAALSIPPAPPANQGFQIRLGPILLEPYREVEYFKKHELLLPDSLEVNRIEIFMNTQSHHYIIYKFNPGSAASFPDGFRTPNQNPSGLATSPVVIAQYSKNYELPNGTAFKWPLGTVLDLNYHVINYSPDSIFPAYTYANIYTQPKGTAQKEMFSNLILYSKYNNPLIFNIPNNGVNKTFTDTFAQPSSPYVINLWQLSTHTHKWGRDYDVYKRNPDGTRGIQLYEGFYDVNYTFNQGFYDWAHPAIREFDPLEPIVLKDGLIHEAFFNNTGNSTVFFGLTSNDEMMLITVMYTLDLLSGYSENLNYSNSLEIFPNPTSSKLYVQFSGFESNIDLSLYNLYGQKIYTLYSGRMNSGIQTNHINLKDLGISHGQYLLKLEYPGGIETKKIIFTE